MKETLAVVVTYNRKELLRENLQALYAQTDDNFDILVVDNAGTDGSADVIHEYSGSRLMYRRLKKNTGGAGGFFYGVKQAAVLGYKYCWLMDDDTIPKKDAFKSLVRKREMLYGDYSYICSMVKWIDGEPCVMNMTEVSKDWYDNGRELDNGLLPVESCSFVSVLIPVDMIRKVGLPIRQFFIYGDDREYTERLGREKQGFLDRDSIVVHKMENNRGTGIKDVPEDRIERCFYDSRNRFYIAKQNGIYGIAVYFYYQLKAAFDIITNSGDTCKGKRLAVLAKGTLAGLLFNPKIEKI